MRDSRTSLEVYTAGAVFFLFVTWLVMVVLSPCVDGSNNVI